MRASGEYTEIERELLRVSLRAVFARWAAMEYLTNPWEVAAEITEETKRWSDAIEIRRELVEKGLMGRGAGRA